MAWLSLLLGAVSAAIFLTYQGEVNACSCQPMHPQDLYCRSGFVIKALVSKGRLIELGPDGRYKRVHKHHEEEKEKDETESSGIPEEVEEGLLPRRRKVIHTTFNGYSSSIAYKHTLQEYSSSDPRRKRSALRPSRIHRRARFNDPPGMASGNYPDDHDSSAPPRKMLMVQYRINIIKIFKGLENFTKSQLDFVYTPPAPLCNVELATNRSPYILMGDVRNGALVTKLCDYQVDLLNMSHDERRNVVRNMESRYPKECGRCRVQMCNRGGCEEGTAEPFTCIWKEWWSAHSPWSSQFACIHAKNGKCKWYYPLSKVAKPEDIDEWRR